LNPEKNMSETGWSIGFLLFPGLTQLDLTGPYEVFARLPGTGNSLWLIWKNREPVASDSGMAILPNTTFADRPRLDIVCVPGGPGVGALMEDAETLDFLRAAAEEARYVTSICTGSLVLGAAGLLRGRRAACHWMSRDLLAAFGAKPIDERVVVDGNLVTGGGVTAGIDFALTLVGEIAGVSTARKIQLVLEYDPAPPFQAGSDRSAPAALVAEVRADAAARQSERAEIVARAAARLDQL
jgi:cyclohexyl-isocyanide hydratase